LARYSLLFHVIWQFLSVDDEADVAELIAEVKIGRINAVRAKAYEVTGIWDGEAVFDCSTGKANTRCCVGVEITGETVGQAGLI
jgi:hypothetical protein